MFKLVIAVLVITCLAVHAASDVNSEWVKHKTKHGKRFSSGAEETKRKSHFSKTHDMITKHKSKPNATFEMEHNQFSDMTDEEKAAYHGANPQSTPTPRDALFKTATVAEVRALPASVDWRNSTCMQPVPNQGSCGSCWAFAATAVVEFNSCVKSGKAVALSQQQMVSCDKSNGACGGGWPPSAWSYIAKARGQVTRSSYPYTSSAGAVAACKFSLANVAAKVSTTSPTTYIAAKDTNAMMTALNNKNLVLVAICATSPFMSYKTGVFTDTSCGTKQINHAVVAVGYGTLNGLNYWIIRNSWGTSWGQAGYVLFQRGTNLCGVETYPMYTTIA